MNDVKYGRCGHIEALRKRYMRVCTARVETPDSRHFRFCQPRAGMVFSDRMRHPTFGFSIPHIVSVSSWKKMSRIEAGRIVAVVTDFLFAGNSSTIKNPGQPVKPVRFSLEHDVPIAASIPPSSPNPTGRFQRTLNNLSVLVQPLFEFLYRNTLPSNPSPAVLTNLNAVSEFHSRRMSDCPVSVN